MEKVFSSLKIMTESIYTKHGRFDNLEKNADDLRKLVYDIFAEVNKRNFTGRTSEFRMFTSKFENIKTLLFHAIDTWKIVQRRSLNGSGLVEDFSSKGPECLRSIADSCEKFLVSIKIVLEKLYLRNTDCANEIVPTLKGIVEEFVQDRALIIVNQPTQILKVEKDIIKNIPFTVKLLGQECLRAKSTLQIIPIYEADVKEASSSSWAPNSNTHHFGKIELSGPLVPNRSTTDSGFVWHAAGKTCRMTAVNRQEKMERKDFIREKKYFFVFRVECEIDIAGFEPMFAKDISLPVALIKHVTQTVDALGTIFWFNLFGNKLRGKVQDSENPTEAKWEYLANFLQAIWSKKTFHGSFQRPLQKDDLRYLASRVLRCSYDADITNRNVSWDHFHRDRLQNESGKDFTFWKYFYACLTTASNYKIEWAKGIIFGFATPGQRLLLNSQGKHGSFLVRFSEKAINKDQSQEISGQLTLEVLYITSQNNRVILKTRQNLKDKDLKKNGIVPILLSMEYECPRTKKRNPLLTTLILPDKKEQRFDANSPYVKSMTPAIYQQNSYSYGDIKTKTKILVDVSKVDRVENANRRMDEDRNDRSNLNRTRNSMMTSDLHDASDPKAHQTNQVNMHRSPDVIDVMQQNSFACNGMNPRRVAVDEFSRTEIPCKQALMAPNDLLFNLSSFSPDINAVPTDECLDSDNPISPPSIDFEYIMKQLQMMDNNSSSAKENVPNNIQI